MQEMQKMQETWVRSLDWENLLEATHSSILAYKIWWTEEPGGLQSMEQQRVKHDWAHARVHTHTHTHRYVYIYHQWAIIQPWEEWNLVIYVDMHESKGFYAKWNQSEEEKYCMISLVCYLKK